MTLLMFFAVIAIYWNAPSAHVNVSSYVLSLRNLISKINSGNVELFICVQILEEDMYIITVYYVICQFAFQETTELFSRSVKPVIQVETKESQKSGCLWFVDVCRCVKKNANVNAVYILQFQQTM